MRVADDALRVHQEHRARIHAALLVEHTIGLAHRAMRPVVRQQRERNATELFRPGLQAGDGVGADLEDFDVEFLECIEVLTEPQDLVLSSTREGERQKGHDGPFALVTGKRERLVQLRGKREPWSDGTRRECRHERSP